VTAAPGAVTLVEAADEFLSSPRAASPRTRRTYFGVLDRLSAELGPSQQLAAVSGDEIAQLDRPDVPSGKNSSGSASRQRKRQLGRPLTSVAPQVPGAVG
jgi:hypothetical protein